MKRLAVLLGLLTAGAVSMTLAQQQPQQRPPAALEIQKVKENLYVIIGGGGNTAAFITEKGVVTHGEKGNRQHPHAGAVARPPLVVRDLHLTLEHVIPDPLAAGVAYVVGLRRFGTVQARFPPCADCPQR